MSSYQHVKVPASGACILATNHMSRLDTPLLMVYTPRHDLIALVTDKYKTNPLFSFMVKVTGSVWIDRDRADFAAFRSVFLSFCLRRSPSRYRYKRLPG